MCGANLALKHGNVRRPWRCSEMPLEYFFGTLRTALNSGQLPDSQMLELVDKIKELETFGQRNNWGRWSAQGAGQTVHSTGLLAALDLSDAKFMAIGFDMSTTAQFFFEDHGLAGERHFPVDASLCHVGLFHRSFLFKGFVDRG